MRGFLFETGGGHGEGCLNLLDDIAHSLVRSAISVFPLEPGKKWNFGAKGIVRNNVNHYDNVVIVEAYEDVATKAGTFKAFRIKREVTIRPIDNRGRGASWVVTEWFSPTAKAVVKWTSTNPNQLEWELTAYTLK